MAKKGSKFKKYSPEFKISCIIDMWEHDLSYNETARKCLCENGKESCFRSRLKLWEHIFLEEGKAGFYIERRGRTTKVKWTNTKLPENIYFWQTKNRNVLWRKV